MLDLVTDKQSIRNTEIQSVIKGLGIPKDNLFILSFPSTGLDTLPLSSLISALSNIIHSFEPSELLIPHFSDVHSDHRIAFDAVSACTKWFRYPSIRRVLAYETLSETEFDLHQTAIFRPNYFIDISSYLDKKLDLLSIYHSELGDHPFPRSIQTVRSLASLRGSQRGVDYAEAYQLLRAFE